MGRGSSLMMNGINIRHTHPLMTPELIAIKAQWGVHYKEENQIQFQMHNHGLMLILSLTRHFEINRPLSLKELTLLSI